MEPTKHCPGCGFEHELQDGDSFQECQHCGTKLLVCYFFSANTGERSWSVERRGQFKATPTEDGGLEISWKNVTEGLSADKKEEVIVSLTGIAAGLLSTADMAPYYSDHTIQAMIREDAEKIVKLLESL